MAYLYGKRISNFIAVYFLLWIKIFFQKKGFKKKNKLESDMKKKTTWIGNKGIDRKGQNQNIIQRQNCFGQWLNIESEESRK